MGEVVERIQRRSQRPIFSAFLDSMHRKGPGALAVIDGDGRKLTYRDLTRAAFALAGPLERMTKPAETVGIMLPTGAGAVIAFLALQAIGRVPAMMNFTAGARTIKASAKAAQVTKILCARKFVEIGKLEALIADLSESLEIVHLEDIRAGLRMQDKARAIVAPMAPHLFAETAHPDDPGVVLFTSGTEGDPKGVVLSHANIVANIEQIAEHVEILPTDIFFNPLPIFHCYGLTAGALWPILVGYPVALHPSPLQTKAIPERIAATKASVLFATDTFLQQYMRAADDGALDSLRLVVCGGERVKDETRQAAARKFSFEVLEGYGVTEAAPVLAANQPGDIRSGTVGRMLPSVEVRLDPVEGMGEAGRLYVRGPNIMKGYVTPSEPGVIKPLADGWHDTGDIVSIDGDGYVRIRGRMKRFAKIGGEMVSLAVVENCASAVWPDNMHAAATIPSDRKGEEVVLLTDHPDPDRSLLLFWAQNHGVPEIAVPKKIFAVNEVPLLGTGKIDYVSVGRMARAAAGVDPQPANDVAAEKKRIEKLASIEARINPAGAAPTDAEKTRRAAE